MDKIWGYVIDIFIAILIIFASVTIYFGLRTEMLMKTLGKNITEDFMEEAKKDGYITVDEYDDFTEKLSLTDAIYDISLEHKYNVLEPEYRFRTVQEIIDAQKAAYTGANIYHYKEIHTDKPFVIDPVNTGNLNTETNESILAKAVNTPASPDHVHTNACYAGHRHNGSCDGGLSCYTGRAVTLYHTQRNNNFEMGTNVDYREIYCAECGSRTASICRATSDISNPIAGYINVTQWYLDKDGNIEYIHNFNIGQYLISDTYKEGWIHVNNDYVDQYRTPNPEFWKYSNCFDFIAGDFFGYVDNKMVYDVRMDALHALGYQDKCSCPFCLQAGRIAKTFDDGYTCGKTQDGTLDCGQIVTNIAPTNPVQTVYVNDKLITTVVADYLNGSKKTVLAATDFSTTGLCENQQAKLTYSYTIDGINYSKTCNISVTVIPRTKTCASGHTYNLNSDGSDPGCPYCKVYVKNIGFINPSGTSMTITIGTTLQDNEVKLLITYMDGHREEINNGYIDNLDTAYLGAQNVTIGYKGVTVLLSVTTICAKMKCDICGNTYELYPDQTNPGCPYCISKTPVFTGKILTYETAEYTETILDKLYRNGVYRFNKNDTFSVNIKNKSKNIARNLLKKVYPSLSDRWFVLKISMMIGGSAD